MSARLRKRLSAVVQNPKNVTVSELLWVADAIGCESHKTKEGWKLILRGEFVFTFPVPHPDKHVRKCYIDQFVSIARLKERMLTDE